MKPLRQLYMCMFIDMKRFTVNKVKKSYAYYDHICMEKFWADIHQNVSSSWLWMVEFYLLYFALRSSIFLNFCRMIIYNVHNEIHTISVHKAVLQFNMKRQQYQGKMGKSHKQAIYPVNSAIANNRLKSTEH